MGYRDEAFRIKFADAAKHLGASVEQVVSLKVRDDVVSHSEYRKLLETLRRDMGLEHSPIAGNYQGNGHLVGNVKTKIIVVEHETGLEILYIAGSVASIIALIPVVLRCWRVMRGNFSRSRHPDFQIVEIRRMDNSGCLVEETEHGMGFPWSDPLDMTNKALLSATENIDGEIQQLKTAVSNLTRRMIAVEKKLAGNKSSGGPRPRQATANKKQKR